MRIPGLIWSSIVLLCAVVTLPAQRTLFCAVYGPAILIKEQQLTDRAIAARFAPVFYQALGDKPRSDYITNFDFDGDWRGANNWEHADDKNFSLRAYVYYSVCETQTHFFIHYAAFHPRDYKGGERKGLILSEIIREGIKRGGTEDPTGLMAEAGVAHENDMEGVLVVVAKNGKPAELARVVFVETLHHNDFSPYVTGEATKGIGVFKANEQRVLLYVEPKGHGIEAYSGDDKQTAGKEFLIYNFSGNAEDPDKQKDGSVGYELIPIQTTLWPRARTPTKDKGATYATLHDFGQLSINVAHQTGRSQSRKSNWEPLAPPSLATREE